MTGFKVSRILQRNKQSYDETLKVGRRSRERCQLVMIEKRKSKQFYFRSRQTDARLFKSALKAGGV